MEYHVTSLSQIADWFDTRAARCLSQQVGKKPRESAVLAIQARTWKDAAEMLRATIIDPA